MAVKDDELFMGLMTGTSMDGVDAVAVRFSPAGAELLATLGHPFDSDLRRELLAVSSRSPLHLIAELDVRLGICLADAASSLMRQAGLAADAVTAIGSHGQTVYHMTSQRWPCTVQIGDPNIIVERTGVTTIADFRRRDIAAGGEGAPLAPVFHRALFADEMEDRVVVNIGGMANLSYLPAHHGGRITGFDTGPGNVLMDSWIWHQRGLSHDRNGDWAASGTVDTEMLDRMRQEPFFALPPPKSTGRDLFNMEWILRRIADGKVFPDAADVQATLCELTASTIADGVRDVSARPGGVVICGGGAYNTHLIRRIRAHLPGYSIASSESLGMAPDWVEATGFAWLAREALARRPASVVSVTGARHATVLGGIYQA